MDRCMDLLGVVIGVLALILGAAFLGEVAARVAAGLLVLPG